MKNKTKFLSVIALFAIITLTLAVTACGDGGGSGPSKPPSTPPTDPPPPTTQTFTTIAAFKTWLDAQPANTAAKAYSVKVNIDDLGGSRNTAGSLGNALYTNDTKYVNLDLSGSTLTSIGGYAFLSCRSLTSVTIPNSVTSIEIQAFSYCRNLTSVTIPNSVTSIGAWAFSDCTSLTSVTIGNSVTSIGDRAFQNCTSLTSVTIPASVTSIVNWAFMGCTSLTSVTFAVGSNIANGSFGKAFPEGSDGVGGDTLKSAYNAASTKSGEYTRAPNGSTWSKS